MGRLRMIVGVLAAMVIMGCGVSSPSPSRSPDRPIAEEFQCVDGGVFRWPTAQECRAIVILFVGHDCPISNGYAPEIGRLRSDDALKQVTFVIVYADAEIDRETARRHAEEYRLAGPAIVDPRMILARRFGATVKPEAVVVDPQGQRRYLGRIDDRYIAFGKRREHVTRHDLRDAIDDVLNNRRVAVPTTKAIGCDIDFPAD